MPRLLGDEPYEDFAESPNRRRLALTHTQHALLTRWRDGAFTPATGTLTPGAFRAPAKLDITPWGLDRAALEACVGGAFYPGIEAGWQMRHEDLFGAPFRIKHGAPSSYLTDTSVVAAGHFSRQMAVPWQADFMDCKIEQSDATTSELRGKWGWWPAQRPDDVPGPTAQMLSWTRGSDNSHAWMVANWHKLGFVLRVGQSDQFAESGRVEP